MEETELVDTDLDEAGDDAEVAEAEMGLSLPAGQVCSAAVAGATARRSLLRVGSWCQCAYGEEVVGNSASCGEAGRRFNPRRLRGLDCRCARLEVSPGGSCCGQVAEAALRLMVRRPAGLKRWLRTSRGFDKDDALQRMARYCGEHDPEAEIRALASPPKAFNQVRWLFSRLSPRFPGEEESSGSLKKIAGVFKGLESEEEDTEEEAPRCSITPVAHACSARPQESFLGPSFVNAGVDGANATRAEQATLAATLQAFLIETLRAGWPARAYTFYTLYRELSGDGAGVYYDNKKYAQIGALPRHFFDISFKRLCFGNLAEGRCAYAKGRRHEREVGAFRVLNSLESTIFYSCNDPHGPCVPGMQPVFGYQRAFGRRKWHNSTTALGAIWASHYYVSAIEFGEGLWQPQEPGGAACGLEARFTPNRISKRSY